MANYTYKRFVRNPNLKPFRVQERDVELLQLLADYRFLDTYQIASLQPRGMRNLRRRLQYLFHAGLVDRPPRQHDFLKPPMPLVYGLANKGADALAQVLEVDRGKIDWQTKNREAGLPYIDHTLMIANFRATLSLAMQSLDHSRLLSWKQGPDLKANVKVRGRTVAVVPDGFFALESKGHLQHFLLEADRSTMTTMRYFRKLRAYWLWWKAGGHRRKFGIPRFRVLTVTTSEKRKENLRRLATDADDGRRGSPMFLFACNKSFSLGDPQTILEPIWQSPANNTLQRILC